MEKENSWTQGEIYHEIVRNLYCRASEPDALSVYKNWLSLFVQIHGELDGQRKVNIPKLNRVFGIIIESEDSMFRFVFSLETYYSILLRLVAYKTITGGSSFSYNAFDDSFFSNMGIINYSCPNNLNWFVSYREIESLLANIYDEITVSREDLENDFVSKIFESIFPKEIRHGLGEFYTPVWLATHLVNTVTAEDEMPHLKSYIDPTCGSGSFLVAIINKFKYDSNGSIFKSICGVDINPLTVLGAKTNYLLLYYDYYHSIPEAGLDIPIYYADTIHGHDAASSLFENSSDYDRIPENQYDYVVGNPPWVNWEYLPTYYKTKYAYLWLHYGLYKKTGLSSNFVKEDISVLLTYVVIDKYLKEKGRIAFIVKETLFKSIKQGEGFRNFYLLPTNQYIGVWQVDDLSNANPFRGAVTRSALFYATKGVRTKYPIPYHVWNKPKRRNRVVSENTITAELFDITHLLARPSDKVHLNSGWITESADKSEQSNAVLGNNDYVARTGTFTGGANAIYWLRILEDKGNTVMIQNITERAKNKADTVIKEVEKELVFPFLTGKELNFWDYSYSKYILCPHNAIGKMYPISHEELSKLPFSNAYFTYFQQDLKDRKGFTSFDKEIHKKYYYTLQRIGEYTFAPYKVCWRYICKSFTPAVVEYVNDPVLGNKNIICNEKIISIGLSDKLEAYYLCGLISSTPYRETIESYMVGTQITPSIINKLSIPKFNPNDELHMIIAKECLQGHSNKDKIEQHLQIIDDTVNKMLKGTE